MRTTAVTGLTLFLLACGAESADPATLGTNAENLQQNQEPSAPDVETAYAIHEWGFIAHHYAAGESEVLTYGTAPAPEHLPMPIRHHPSGRSGGKPVIYVHLQGEGNIARFNASLSTTGRFLEEWPHSEGSTLTSLSWDVEAREGSCSADGSYPVAADEHCAGIADHYCEAAELAHYETEDSACLTVDGHEWNHLFYRAQIGGDVPLRVSKSGAAFTVHNAGTLPGRLMRIRRSANASETRVALFDPPAAGESLVLPSTPDQPAAIGIAALESELSARGMSEDEVGAFMTAWQAELFGDTPERAQVEMVGSPPRDLRPKDDALIYFLPIASLDAMVPLAFTPPPAEIRRAVLVRIDLGEAHVDTSLGTIRVGSRGLGNDGGFGYGRPPNRHTVRMGQVVVEGAFAPEVIQRLLRRHLNQLRGCAEQHLSGGEVEVEVRFAVNETGVVHSASAENGPAALRACLAAAINGWSFPAPDNGTLTVVVPLSFASPE